MVPTAGDVVRAPASVLLLVRLAAEHAVAADVVLAGTGLTPADLERADQPVTAAQELTVIANLLRALGDPPGLGLEAGQRYHLTTYGIWGFALVSSPTLRNAVSVGLRYLDLTFSFCRLTPRDAAEGLVLVLDASAAPEPLRRFVLEREAAAIQTIQCEVLGTATAFRAVTSTADPPPEVRARYAGVFGVEPVFGAAEDAVVLDAALVDRPLPQAEPHTAQLAEAQCRELLQRRRARAGVAEQVRRLLVHDLRHPPTVDEVAGRLHLSARSLRRRLDQEGTSFRGLLDEVRRELALELLTGARLTVAEAADRLGYAEPASFTHAFRRWTGTSPREHRRSAAR